MAEKVQNYEEYDREREEGHVDTRSKNFECANPDEHLGCNPGIDVAGQLSCKGRAFVVTANNSIVK